MPRWLDRIVQDTRYALRVLGRTPAVTGIAVLSLALGIGANTAIFNIVNAVMLRTLPVGEAERLVILTEGQEGTPASYTNPIWETFRDRQQTLAGAFAYTGARFDVATGGAVQYVEGFMASGAAFDVLQVPAAIGRTFTTADDRRGCAPVAVLSHGYWQRRYGSDPGIVGSVVRLDGHPFSVIGVTVRGFHGIDVGRTFDIAVPMCTEDILRGAPSKLDDRRSWWLTIAGRLKPGQTIEQAARELQRIQPAVRDATIPTQYRAQDAARYLSTPFRLASPVSGASWQSEIDVPGRPLSQRERRVYGNAVSTGYFEALQTPFLAGRDFVESDGTPGGRDIAVVNETFARQFFPGSAAVGQSFHHGEGKDRQTSEIIGVVRDAKYRSLRLAVPPTMYVPTGRTGGRGRTFSLIVRARGEAGALVPAITHRVRSVSGGLTVEFRTLAAQVDDSLSRERLLAILGAFFGLLALLLAAIGLYGVLSHSVARRRGEIGVRMALGAHPARVVRLVMRDVGLMLLGGLAAGVSASLGLTRFVSALLYGVEGGDWTTLAIAAATLTAVSVAASLLPARRAARLDPVAALGNE